MVTGKSAGKVLLLLPSRRAKRRARARAVKPVVPRAKEKGQMEAGLELVLTRLELERRQVVDRRALRELCALRRRSASCGTREKGCEAKFLV